MLRSHVGRGVERLPVGSGSLELDQPRSSERLWTCPSRSLDGWSVSGSTTRGGTLGERIDALCALSTERSAAPGA